MNIENPQYILLMKVGPYCGYSLEEIISIKMMEEKKIGKFFWGYSGVFCRPNILQNFVSHAHSNNQNIKVMFTHTMSSYIGTNVDRFGKFSSDGSNWKDIPREVLLVGTKNKPHFAITGKNLEKVDIKLDLSQYCSISGIFVNEERYLDEYFRYRVDKACGYYLPRANIKEKIVDISYISDFVDPFSVYIK
ncbi:hypothetical protein M0R04_00605 [Candidatus Dojkabacteria bacterium]|jgi:hypothetical protein|nr:hypothetical protein [Candidatus Dojkabacteria bacterium]